MFCNMICLFLRWGVVSTLSKPQAGGPPLVGYPWLFIQYIRSYPPYSKPFLHTQPEDVPYRGERDLLIADYFLVPTVISLFIILRLFLSLFYLFASMVLHLGFAMINWRIRLGRNFCLFLYISFCFFLLVLGVYFFFVIVH